MLKIPFLGYNVETQILSKLYMTYWRLIEYTYQLIFVQCKKYLKQVESTFHLRKNPTNVTLSYLRDLYSLKSD